MIDHIVQFNATVTVLVNSDEYSPEQAVEMVRAELNKATSVAGDLREFFEKSGMFNSYGDWCLWQPDNSDDGLPLNLKLRGKGLSSAEEEEADMRKS